MMRGYSSKQEEIRDLKPNTKKGLKLAKSPLKYDIRGEIYSTLRTARRCDCQPGHRMDGKKNPHDTETQKKAGP